MLIDLPLRDRQTVALQLGPLAVFNPFNLTGPYSRAVLLPPVALHRLLRLLIKLA